MEQRARLPVLLLHVLLLNVARTHGEPASQLVVINDLPKEFHDLPKELQSGNHKMIIRSNFTGSIEFIESESFHIDINITAPSVEDLAKVQYQYTDYNGAILLQTYSSEPEKIVSPLPLILLAIGGATLVAMVISTMFVCWWNSTKKHIVNSKKFQNLDESQQAPLLEDRTSHDLPDSKNRRRKKHRQHQPIPGDEYGSSEDEILKEKLRKSKESTHSSRYAYPPTTKVRSLRNEPPLVSSDGESNTPHNMSMEDPPPPPPPPQMSDKPVVSYIKLQPDVADRGGKQQYQKISNDHSDGNYSDIDGQTTLKVRCDDRHNCGSDPMPDVIRGQSQGHRQQSLDRHSSRDSDYEQPLYSQVNKARYKGEVKEPTHTYNDGELQRIFNSPPPSRENEYSTINKSLSGAHIAHILTDKNKGSPKYSHNTNRPPTTFSKLPTQREQNLEQVELDSVGSSRSGESSGVRTGSSYTDSTYGSDKRVPVFTDSDSAHSTASSANRSRDSGLHGGIRYYIKHPSQEADTDEHFPSPSGSDPNSTSSSSPRLVDEAYGTMVASNGGSNGGSNSGSMNGNNTLRSSSASTGSGSSGSVVTVINNDDPTGLGGRKRVYFKNRQSPAHVNGNGSLERRTGGGGGLPPHYMHTSILCCLSVICLVTGVYTYTNNETQVNIKIYAPFGYLKSVPEVYTRKEKNVSVSFHYELQVMNIMHYEIKEPYHADLDKNLCDMKSCTHHCDPNTGDCVCKKGFYLRHSFDGGSSCQDKDECADGDYNCHEHAHCVNYNGYYNCVCATGYYGDGDQCQSCDASCLPGSFEVSGCGEPKKQKVCQECSKTCMAGYFIKNNCTKKSNTNCKACSERCEREFFEYTSCDNQGLQDRQCRKIDSLTKPSFSNNILYYENKLLVKPILSFMLSQDPTDSSLTHAVPLSRGDFTLTVSIRDSNLAPVFRPVDHPDSNDNEGFWGDQAITRDYCPYPVPEKYELKKLKHTGMTTKAAFYDCEQMKKEGKKCESETGYYLNPKEACKSYSQFGRLPPQNSDVWSVICTKPGELSSLFKVDSELEEMTTMFVDKGVKCAEQRTNCDSCSVRCAKNMKAYRGSNRCNITGEDSDYGESPRLSYCYGCCNKQECDKMCEVYHNPDCERIRCVTGNVVEFVLQPSWHHSKTVFGCHIEPVPQYNIYDLEVKVEFKNRVINDRKLYYKKKFEGDHPARASVVHDFLHVFYGSQVVGSPNLIEGDTEKNEYSAGYYQANGAPLTKHPVTTSDVNVRPRVPFQVSTKLWKEADCNTKLLDNLVLTDALNAGKPSSDSYKQEPQLLVQYADRVQYKVFNRSEGHEPFIYFEIPQDTSLLAPFFDPTTVRDDGTLRAEIQRATRKWNLVIQGQLSTCPGYFNVKVIDPHYPMEWLFDYDVGVTCPKDFSVTFTLPTEGPDTSDKRLLVEIRDSYRTIKMTVVRPKPHLSQETEEFFWSNKTENSHVNYGPKGEIDMTVFTPFTAVLGVIISSLMLLLCIGFLTDTGKPKRKTDNKVNGQHLVFVVGYVTFRTAYSVAVTFTILVIIIRYVNREPLNTLVEFGRYAETGENSQNQEIEKIQHYVLQELHRQNELANQTKLVCERKLQLLQGTLEKTKEEMIIENNEEKLISQVALEYTKIMIMNLTDNINQFKHKFAGYASKSMKKLTRNILETSSALQSNKWLIGAKVIYDSVITRRRALHGDSAATMMFMDWMGLKQEVERLSAELSLKDFPMPNIQDFLNMDKPKVNFQPSPLPKIQDIKLPKNQWYFHQNEKTPKDMESHSKSRHRGNANEETAAQGKEIISWSSCLVALIIIDAVWFIHRMAKTYSTAKMMLYGCPTFIDCKNSSNSRAQDGNYRPIPAKCFHYIKDLNLRIMKTEFVPKLVATVTTCCALYFVLGVASKLLTVRALASVGYIESLVAPVETTYQLAKTRVKTNAYRINKFEYPFYEELVNMRTKRYQLMLNMYAEVQKSTNLLHDSEFCAWKQMMNPSEQCNCTSATAPKLSFDGCELAPVTPKPYKKKDFGQYRDTLSKSVVPYLNAARTIVMETCHLVLIFVAVLVLVDALGAVIWIYFKRFNLLRLKPMFEVEHFPAPTANHS